MDKWASTWPSRIHLCSTSKHGAAQTLLPPTSRDPPSHQARQLPSPKSPGAVSSPHFSPSTNPQRHRGDTSSLPGWRMERGHRLSCSQGKTPGSNTGTGALGHPFPPPPPACCPPHAFPRAGTSWEGETMGGCQWDSEHPSMGSAMPASMTEPSPSSTPRDPPATQVPTLPSHLPAQIFGCPPRAQPVVGTLQLAAKPPWYPRVPPYLGRWLCCCRSASPGAAHCRASRRARRHRSASVPASPARTSGSRHSTVTIPPLPGPLREKGTLRASDYSGGPGRVP